MKSKIVDINNLDILVNDLLNGEVVAFPTETVYGLAIVYDDIDAFNKLYEIKNRSINKPISMMVNDISNIEKVANIDENSKKVIDKLMPGELTIILDAKDNLPSHVTFNLKTIGVRIPNHHISLEILKKVNKPLLVTSANISNEPALIKYEDVLKTFDGKVSSLVNVDATNGVASSVVSVKNGIKVFRKGNIKENQIKEILK